MSQITARTEKMDTIRKWLQHPDTKRQVGMVAPKHLTPDRILRIAMTSVVRTPKLAECTPESLVGCVLTCTQMGLEPDGVSGRAYLIPFKDKCTLIVGYKGLMDLARRSGEIAALEARVVRKGDKFSYQYGTAPKIEHVPNLDDEGDMIAVYAVAQFKHGGFQFEVMSVGAVRKIKATSKARDDGPWITNFDEMARKTVMRKLCKYLPSSPELQAAVSLDEKADQGIPQDIDFVDVDGTSTPAPDNGKKTLDDLVPAETPKREPKKAKKKEEPSPAMFVVIDYMKLPQDVRSRVCMDHGMNAAADIHKLGPEALNNLRIDVADLLKATAPEPAGATTG